jgi:hypothetical protein
MAEHIPANGGEILYEHEWVEELNKLIAKAGDRDVYVEYLFPAGYLLATGFQPQVDERKIRILLQRQSPSGSASALIELSLPAEESAVYRGHVSEGGERFVSVVYPYCSHNNLLGVQLAEIRISTSAELLNLVTSVAQRV